VADKESLVNREFIGTVLPDKDLLHQGRYKVNIPEIQPHMENSAGIWCKNHVCRHRISPSSVGVSGSYYPLQPGMSVIVKFFANDINSAYIDRVISDAYPQSLPFESIERDDCYVIVRTPKHNHLILVYDGNSPSKNIPKNSFHIYFNNTRTTIVIDELGVHVATDDNLDIKAAKTIKIEAAGDINLSATGKLKIQASGIDIKSTADFNFQASGDINVKSAASINNQASSNIGLKAGGKNLLEASENHFKGTNKGTSPSGVADSAPSAADAASPDAITPAQLITLNDYEYFKRNFGG